MMAARLDYGNGYKKMYESNAEKQKVYRERKKARELLLKSVTTVPGTEVTQK